MTHMTDSVADKNWATIDSIEFYDVDAMSDTDQPRAIYNKEEILSLARANNGKLSIPRADILAKSADNKTDWQIGRIVINLSNMDPLMKEAYDYVDENNVTQHVDEKLLNCKLYGHATLYERDLKYI